MEKYYLDIKTEVNNAFRVKLVSCIEITRILSSKTGTGISYLTKKLKKASQ